MLYQQFFCFFQMRQSFGKFIPLYIFDSVMPVCNIFQIIKRHFFIQPVNIPFFADMYIIVQTFHIFHPDIRIQCFIHQLPDNINPFDQGSIPHFHTLKDFFI